VSPRTFVRPETDKIQTLWTSSEAEGAAPASGEASKEEPAAEAAEPAAAPAAEETKAAE
jgi:hypothetical protein